MKETRRIWCDDQYRVFQTQADKSIKYQGREKGEHYQIFSFSLTGRRQRKLLQSVNLNRDWYWDDRTSSLCAEPSEMDSNDSENNEDVLEGLLSEVQVQDLRLSTGASATVFAPEVPTSWIVSLHGGPESFEGREIRYTGLYRDLLRSGVGIVILNYLGSKRPNQVLLNCLAWGNWKKSIIKDFSELFKCESLKNFSMANVTLYGVSFGGALALILHKEFGIKNTILSSPLLDLGEQKKRGGADFKDWFESRFSDQDFNDFSFNSLTKDYCGEIHVLYGSNDEVLGSTLFERLKREKKLCSTWKVTSRTGGHVPKTYRECVQFKKWALGLHSLL